MAPDADTDTIKRSFRRLAHQYHPDKNPDNTFAYHHFAAIKDAYEVLSDPRRRSDYDKELWLLQQNSIRYTQAVSPALILERLHKVHQEILVRKAYHVIENNLTDYLCALMSDHHIAVFQKQADASQYAQFSKEVLDLCAVLPQHQSEKVLAYLKQWNTGQDVLLDSISAYAYSRRHRDHYRKYRFWIMLMVALFICFLMYWYSRR